MRTILVTNVTQYTGPGVVATLVGQGSRVVCHDASFVDAAARDAFVGAHSGVVCLAAQTPEALVAELGERAINLDADVYKRQDPRP